jgi:hypothetical protein
MVQEAMNTLFRSRDANETSSAYDQRYRAQICATSMTTPPLRGAVSSAPQEEALLSYPEPAGSEAPKEEPKWPSVTRATKGSPPSEAGLTDPANIEQPMSYTGREIVQHIHNVDIQQTSSSRLQDQGVAFDQTGRGYDTCLHG